MVNCGITGYKEIINKFGLNITPNHKVYNKQKNIFTPIDSFATSEELDIMSLKGLITWKKKLLNLMGKSTKDTQRADIILSTQLEMQTEKNANSCTEQSGNITTEKFLKAIKYIIKTKILTITTLATWSVFQLGNIYQNIVKNIGKIKNTEKKCQNLWKGTQKDSKNVEHGIKVKREENGIENTPKEAFTKISLEKKEFVSGAEQNILQKLDLQNIAQFNAKGKHATIEKQKNVLSVEKNFMQQDKEQQCVQENVELNTKEIIPVYNITVENAGCYYANEILVSNCDSLANLFTNVLNCAKVGKSRMKYTREELGI